MRLKNKIALVTGAARGLGEAIARRFVEEGAYVIATDILDDLGQKVVDDLGDSAEYYHLDVTQETEWQTLVKHIRTKHGHLNIAINNAGITGLGMGWGPQDPENATLESWHQVHAVNLDGVFLGCKYAIPLMKEKGGSIINMSSRSGIVGIPRAAAYASSKAAIRNHTKSVALYCTEENYPIRCNSIHPAAILTPIWDPMLGEGEAREKAKAAMESAIPMKKMGEPDDVAYAAIYLASEESKYLTGTEINVDGGILAGSSAAPKKH